ncbi:type II toxin-antitoxin system PemK/MazF family toxin [Bacillus sp. FSL K6-2822]|uniref:type II toxin-antitoxin system PemK/MazF family toxin n=1 Tax=Bacillus cereus group TaxID=86661 RepID=UPI001879C95A|nr:type II toxin-antitoxin system PemK/MazF family toxin [Bacillus paranthracis]MBE7140819.1 hypothetical protein [Bacillus paranthracis]
MTSNVRRGDIYWADLSPVKGSEQGGARPVFVVSNNLMNVYASIVSVVPMTRTSHKPSENAFKIPYYTEDIAIEKDAIKNLRQQNYYFNPKDNGTFLCSQARAISKDRLIEKVGRFTEDTYRTYLSKVENALVDTFGLDSCTSCEVPLGPEAMFCKACKTFYRTKCMNCGKIHSLENNYCPECGKRVNEFGAK